MRIGIFDPIDPPEGMVEIVTKTVAAIDFSWERVQPYLTGQGIDCIRISWQCPDYMSNATTGMWSPADNTIYLSTRFGGWRDDVPFVLTHEIGHMIDRAVLTDRQRKQLMALMHDHPDFSVPPDVTHDAMHHLEVWGNGGAPYPAKVYECWADLFVATFAPSVWDGSVTDAAPQHWPRFVHWSTDLGAVRKIVLAEPKPTPEPKPRPKPPARKPKPRRRRRHRFCAWLHRRR